MGKESSRILLIEILLLIVGVWGLVTTQFNLLIYLIILLFPLVTSLLLLGVEKRGERLTKDSLLILLIGSISYYLITYIIGYFSGFLRTGYSHSISGIIYNVGLWSIFIIFTEVMRGMIIKKGKYYKGLVIFSIFVFSLLEIVTSASIYYIFSKKVLFNLFFTIVIPVVTKNILMTYVADKASYKNNIVYRLIMEIPIYIIPIVPDIGDYLRNLSLLVLPLILLYCHNYNYYESRKIKNGKNLHRNRILNTICDIIIMIVLVCMIVLVSGKFRFIALTIGSGSMSNTINKGDVVIIDKNSNYNVGDIVAFKKGRRILVHRIVYKSENGYNTKGDNNKDRDNWLVAEGDIIGKYMFRIKYIGWLTVWTNEWLNGGV